ncbi:MAG: hypothetical protein WBP81_20410 [Solirubrobacteraceae bacterium]
MTRLLAHVRGNAIAYLALFVALGGTGYAAISLPANSVGTRQLRNRAVTAKKVANGSITSAKLNSSDINGSIRLWARISPTGTVLASKPRAETVGWSSLGHGGEISWERAIPKGCFSLATVDGFGSQGFASVATLNQPRPAGAFVIVQTFNTSGQSAAEPVNVAVICP